MFTIGDIRNIAIQIEKNGEATYRQAAKSARDPRVAEILESIADDEARHAEWFTSLTSAKPLTEEQREMEQVGRTLLQDIVKGNTFLLDGDELAQAEDVGEVISRSISFEEDTILFYEFLLGFLDDQDTSQDLDIIIKEERKHITHLQQLAEPVCDACEDDTL